MVHDSWKLSCEGHVFFVVHMCTSKSLNKEQNRAPEFLILSVPKLASCELMVFTEMNTYNYISTYRKHEFQNILEEVYAIVLNSSYIRTKNMLNMELNEI